MGSAVVVNDLGQAAGATGTCSSFDIFLIVNAPMHPLHAVLWERNGKAIDLTLSRLLCAARSEIYARKVVIVR